MSASSARGGPPVPSAVVVLHRASDDIGDGAPNDGCIFIGPIRHPPARATLAWLLRHACSAVDKRMSRSALWRQEDNLKERERRATQIIAAAIEEGRANNHLRGIIPLHCPDDTFHIHPMLLHNITASPYFQKCCEKLTDWNMVVDEIYYEVKHMEPWTAGEWFTPQ